MRDLRVDIKNVNELSPGISGLIQRSYDREFGSDSMIYASPQWYVLGYVNDDLATRVGVLQRTITIAENPHLIAGVSFLVTEPEYRSRGFAAEIMNHAVVFSQDKLRLPFALLTCKPRLESLYVGMGWKTIDQPNVFVQPTGNRSCGGLIMIKECGDVPWPEGRIDLCGLPW